MFAKGLFECEEHTHERAKNNHAANFDCLARIRIVLWARDSRAASSHGVEFAPAQGHSIKSYLADSR